MVVRVASYNTALSRDKAGELKQAIISGSDKQVLATERLLEHINADIILLNEVDYDAIEPLVERLALQQNYPYAFYLPVNTGQASGRDFDKDGLCSDVGADALGFGYFPGQYGMLLLSRFAIDHKASRSFQHFLWRDMPSAKMPQHPDGGAWFNKQDLDVLPLSSKSHWDVVIEIGERKLHCLCSHPTPPVFDGVERRNACRNHDEIRFWSDYLSTKNYFYDDQGRQGGFLGENFVLLGDLNASSKEGDAYKEAIEQLLKHPKMGRYPFPTSVGGKQHSPRANNSPYHTAVWRMQADYVRLSQGLKLINQGVFWPVPQDPLAQLLKHTSDHRLVFADLSHI